MMDLAVVVFHLLMPDSGVVSSLVRDVGSRVDQRCMCRKQKGAKPEAGEHCAADTGTEGEGQHWGGNLTGLVQDDQPGGPNSMSKPLALYLCHLTDPCGRIPRQFFR